MGGICTFVTTYCPAGRGQRPREALVAEWRLEGLRELLESKIGTLKQFELSEPPEPPDQPPPPNPSATTPPPTPTPPCPDDGECPIGDADEEDWTSEEWRPDAPPGGDRGWTWDEV